MRGSTLVPSSARWVRWRRRSRSAGHLTLDCREVVLMEQSNLRGSVGCSVIPCVPTDVVKAAVMVPDGVGSKVGLNHPVPFGVSTGMGVLAPGQVGIHVMEGG